jgi:polysaccharide export outer membrane protein
MKKIVYLLIFFVLFSGQVFAKDYVIGDGDSLQISVWGTPELSMGVNVRPDGKISIPAIGEVEVRGLTPMELAGFLEEELSKVVKNPIVSVIVTGLTNYQIFVYGNGAPAGVHTLNKETTLLEFLGMLGQLENADLEEAYLVRNKKILKKDFYKLFRTLDFSEDIVLEAKDILFFPDNYEKRIILVGAVNNPTTLTYREGMTILDVILSAGGFTEFAKGNDVIIIRNNGEKEVRRSVKVEDIMEGDLNENIDVMPGDFILVKESFF